MSPTPIRASLLFFGGQGHLLFDGMKKPTSCEVGCVSSSLDGIRTRNHSRLLSLQRRGPECSTVELPEKSDTAQWPSGRPSSSTAVPLTPAHGGGQVFLFLRLVLNQ